MSRYMYENTEKVKNRIREQAELNTKPQNNAKKNVFIHTYMQYVYIYIYV